MDFKFTSEQSQLEDSARRFLKDQYSFDTYLQQLDADDQIDNARWQQMAELGWFGLPFAESTGGYDGSLVDTCLVTKEIGAALSIDPYIDRVLMPGKLLEYVDTDASKTLLSALIEGDTSIALGLYEESAHYDVSAPVSTLKNGRLNGKKHFVSHINDDKHDNKNKVIALVTHNGEHALVLVSLAQPGVATQSYRMLNGTRASSITFSDTEVTDKAILARGQAAHDAVEKVLDYSRVTECAYMYGAAKAVYEKTLEYARMRRQFGTSIGSFQVIQHYLVDMFIDLQQLESMLWMMAVKGESTDAITRKKAVSCGKNYFAKTAVLIAQQAIQIHGGIGVTEELDIGHHFRQITHLSLSNGDANFHLQRYIQCDQQEASND
ncbi:MAG: acyl-CoA dehydrogenase family protein [Gammaproteobacteria bacterium]|jgi:alkylation response protein AidB-like acyl-CoA dehydrogenase|nr:acyl-CoA dehydrogenase family protein [Gammaproteobacteria bacterium]MBQ0773313.1 acyl-CoA dehydrogenase family protein [Gammaproteobacteria bacterium]|tara:strand:+ start:51410 stop:52546 length:1137 start_codon:yes stop_codon:yes gene_type:complete